jgi:ABC-2 type transport system ATP-binding protein
MNATDGAGAASGIVVEELTKTYRAGSVRALDRVSIQIRHGETFGIIGPNGAGKTTLLGCLLGFLSPDAGRVTIDGHAPDDLDVRAVTGYLPERLVMDRWMTGADFLRYHHALARLPAERRDADVDATLQLVDLDDQAGRRAVKRYSRGMLQRLGLGQALLGSPRYLFLDEPASGVDPGGVVLIRRILSDLKGRGVTVVLNSHQLDQVERVCDRVAFVRQGHVDAVETLQAGAQSAHVLRVRWTEGAPEATSSERLGLVARDAGAELRGVTPPEARFTVSGDVEAARLVRALVGAGVPIIEVTPEEGRLERLFLEPRAGTPPAPPAPPAGGAS